jgi:hypothetical protein
VSLLAASPTQPRRHADARVQVGPDGGPDLGGEQVGDVEMGQLLGCLVRMDALALLRERVVSVTAMQVHCDFFAVMCICLHACICSFYLGAAATWTPSTRLYPEIVSRLWGGLGM